MQVFNDRKKNSTDIDRNRTIAHIDQVFVIEIDCGPPPRLHNAALRHRAGT
jgi:hypothetical protein